MNITKCNLLFFAGGALAVMTAQLAALLAACAVRALSDHSSCCDEKICREQECIPDGSACD